MIKPGTRIKFTDDRCRWQVRATSENFAVCTRQADFRPRGELFYTVVDFRQNIRGPVNVIGQGWKTETDEECRELVELVEAGKWAVSHRNRVALSIEDVA